jgi:hypothetical protein
MVANLNDILKSYSLVVEKVDYENIYDVACKDLLYGLKLETDASKIPPYVRMPIIYIYVKRIGE